jgi:succinate dehydrogenase / fumarate reductase, cytochrome b subunit
MSEAAHALPAQSGSFIRTRLGSLLAVMPLGVWTVSHIWSNLAAFRGGEAWQESVTAHQHPIAFFATSAVVLAPLLLHTAWGLSRMFVTRPNIQRYSFFGNTRFLLQRASALGVMGFLGAHVWLAMLHPRLVEGHAEPFNDIASQMHHHTPTLAVYTLGTLGVAYHLANGLSTFAMGWGLVGSRRALQKLEYATYALFAVLLAASWAVLYALWAAGTNLPVVID